MNPRFALVALFHCVCVLVGVRVFFYITPTLVSDPLDSVVSVGAAVLVSWYTLRYTNKWLEEQVSPDGKAVLITGCDSGFGKRLAARLDSKGYHVFASCLFPAGTGAASLKSECSDRLQIFRLDITKDDSVQEALKFVKENLGTSELWAIVNNAGIHKGFSVELTPLQDFKDSFEVNVYGMIRVTKAFLPLLRQSKGRIVNITSLVGRVAMPHVTPYTMSKFAAAAFNDCLRQEMDAWEVPVISIEPELFQTGLTEKKDVGERLETTLGSVEGSIKSDYRDHIKGLKAFKSRFLDYACPNIDIVVDDLESAVSSALPDYSYAPRRNTFARIMLYIYEISPILLKDSLLKVTLFYLKYLNF